MMRLALLLLLDSSAMNIIQVPSAPNLTMALQMDAGCYSSQGRVVKAFSLTFSRMISRPVNFKLVWEAGASASSQELHHRFTRG